MKFYRLAWLSVVLLTACQRVPQEDLALSNIHLIDFQGMTQTISARDRLKSFEKIDFLQPQAYQKVLRNYTRDKEGNLYAEITSYYPSGQIMQFLRVRNGSAFGVFKEWHSNGQLSVEAFVISGTPDLIPLAQENWLFDGHSKAWDREGRLLADISYSKGEREGPCFLYHTNGSIWQQQFYSQNQLEGMQKTFFSGGQLLLEIPYCKGERQGIAQRFWNDEQVSSWERFDRDLLMEAHYFDQTGKELAAIKEGQGIRIIFSKESVSERQEYRNGRQEGLIESFSKEGFLIHSVYKSLDRKNGEEITYYPPNGKDPLPQLSLYWKEGILQGTVKTWYVSGVLQSQREMSKNQRQGLAWAFYPTGELMLVEEYEHDKLIKGEYYHLGDSKPVSRVEQGKGVATLFNEEGESIQRVLYQEGLP